VPAVGPHACDPVKVREMALLNVRRSLVGLDHVEDDGMNIIRRSDAVDVVDRELEAGR
jgi:hypothetical protein